MHIIHTIVIVEAGPNLVLTGLIYLPIYSDSKILVCNQRGLHAMHSGGRVSVGQELSQSLHADTQTSRPRRETRLDKSFVTGEGCAGIHAESRYAIPRSGYVV